MKRFKQIMLILVISLLSLVSLLPFYMMFIMSTHVTEDLFKGLVLLPGKNLIPNVKTALDSGLLIFYKNSLFVSVISTILSVIVSALAGFALSKYRFRYRDAIFNFILLTMMVPTQLGLVAYVVQMRYMGLNNSLLPLIFPR